MRRKRTTTKLSSSGVNFEEGVLEFLDQLSETEDRSRSYVVNKIIKEYAESRGAPIVKPSLSEASSEAPS